MTLVIYKDFAPNHTFLHYAYEVLSKLPTLNPSCRLVCGIYCFYNIRPLFLPMPLHNISRNNHCKNPCSTPSSTSYSMHCSGNNDKSCNISCFWSTRNKIDSGGQCEIHCGTLSGPRRASRNGSMCYTTEGATLGASDEAISGSSGLPLSFLPLL